MSCRELEKLLGAGASPASDEVARHRAACGICAREAADVDETEKLTAALTPPAMPAALREALLDIPARTVSCGRAADLIAASVAADGAISPLSDADRSRLEFHLGRCEGCREAHAVLAGVPELVQPQSAPWFPARLAASRPAKRRPRWRGLLDPRAAIGFAYGSALIVMIAGFNPADLARKAGSNFRQETRTAESTASAASGSLADRAGAVREQVSRSLAILKGRVGGYGRAILTNAVSLVMKTEEPAPPPTRPRNGEGKAVPKAEIEIPTWRA